MEKETPAKVAPAPAKADVDNLIEDPDADIATMDGMEKEVSEDEAKIGDTSYGTSEDYGLWNLEYSLWRSSEKGPG